MKSFLMLLKSILIDFIDNKPQNKHSISLHSNHLITAINNALQEQAPIHIISHEKSVTGTLIKYDKLEGQVILNDSQNNLTSIIPLNEIEKVTLLPRTSINNNH
ncbi:hypothetical protein [Streptococcus porcinus]|uniref:Uncharacterized protein n=1 Tax=Streptococcus porcinus str. Jelinkova 176 TaxID=873448 RepID=A0ABP2L381_STRPO|nr:hypothetical protein [Streptococcus porcinus]EGJ28162.1 hypothetical protein STRPO_0713 [Streptococcus porcinus str. Jelinkova 176]SQG44708.1 Uncharacterised protein [Streptococcus porcinus]